LLLRDGVKDGKVIEIHGSVGIHVELIAIFILRISDINIMSLIHIVPFT